MKFSKPIFSIIFFLCVIFKIVANDTGNSYTKKRVEIVQKRNSSDTIKQSKINNADSFNEFWFTFRHAILQDDTSFIIKHTIFPIKVRGPLDGEPIVELNKENFTTIFNVFLNQISGLNTENYSETELEYIVRNPTLPLENLNKFNNHCPTDIIMVGAMEFENADNEWYLRMLYLEYSTFEKAGILYPE
ncbi:MAG: hypothetical protein PHH42_05730 [Bacteroidales bacterium]|nr:hypothetical protein [Bacteroidales bacterium]MDD4742788.1 hypothetical protein [Bacteroidales bacterium]